MTLKKTCIVVCLLALLPAFALADYDANIKNGLAAYKQNNLRLAYKYYSAAYWEKPSPKLINILKFLKDRIQAGTAPALPPVKKGEQGFPWNWVVLGADTLSLGVTVLTAVDYNKQADTYDALYATMDNTTPEAYAKLQEEDKKFYDKQGAFVASLVVTVLLAGYTAVDALWLHAAFPLQTSMNYDPGNKELKLAVNYRF